MRTREGDDDPRTGPSPERREGLLEREVRRLVAEGRAARAADMIARVHGAELFGFLAAVLDAPQDAANVYADATRAMAHTLESATWGCAVRTFAYYVVRRELARHRRLKPAPRRDRRFDSVSPECTQPRRPIARSKAVAELRSRLADEDRELLILRVDRQLPWDDIAISSLGWDAPQDALAREVTRVVGRVAAIRKQLAEATDASPRGSE